MRQDVCRHDRFEVCRLYPWYLVVIRRSIRASGMREVLQEGGLGRLLPAPRTKRDRSPAAPMVPITAARRSLVLSAVSRLEAQRSCRPADAQRNSLHVLRAARAVRNMFTAGLVFVAPISVIVLPEPYSGVAVSVRIVFIALGGIARYDQSGHCTRPLSTVEYWRQKL
jgi:hypothetical protein